MSSRKTGQQNRKQRKQSRLRQASVAVRVADVRPELASYMGPGIHTQHSATRGKSTPHRVQPRRLPEARNESAADGAGNSPHCRCSPSRGRLMRDNRAHQSVLQSRSKAFLAGSMITQFLMPHAGHAELNAVLYDMRAHGGTEAFAKSCHATTPLVRTVAEMLYPRARSGVRPCCLPECVLYVLVPIGLMRLHRRWCYFSQQQQHCHGEATAHPTCTVAILGPWKTSET